MTISTSRFCYRPASVVLSVEWSHRAAQVPFNIFHSTFNSQHFSFHTNRRPLETASLALRCNDHLHPSIRLTTGGGLVRRDRLGFAAADGGHVLAVDPRGYESVAHCLGARF